jgi:hypothetical protein
MSTTAPDVCEDLERALAAPPPRRRDPFVHTFLVPWWRLMLRRRMIPAGSRALCGYVVRTDGRGVSTRSPTGPRCPRCEQLLREF